MLAAGIGARLVFSATELPPKILLRFGGKSLLQYHIEILQRHGIDKLVLGVGHKHQDIEREITALGAEDFVRMVFNADYSEGSMITLWTLREDLSCGETILLMDGDVIYDEEVVSCLVKSRHRNCLLLDRDFEPGDEPVKVCVSDGEIIEFRKWLSAEYEYCGESVWFFKLSAEMAKKIVLQSELYLAQGRRLEPYEEAIRDVLLTSPRGSFAFEDVTGLPWIKIDFAADIERANGEVLPRILTAECNRRAAMMIKGN